MVAGEWVCRLRVGVGCIIIYCFCARWDIVWIAIVMEVVVAEGGEGNEVVGARCGAVQLVIANLDVEAYAFGFGVVLLDGSGQQLMVFNPEVLVFGIRT